MGGKPPANKPRQPLRPGEDNVKKVFKNVSFIRGVFDNNLNKYISKETRS